MSVEGIRGSISPGRSCSFSGGFVRTRARLYLVSGRGAAWLARLLGVQEVASSNLAGPTKLYIESHVDNPIGRRINCM